MVLEELTPGARVLGVLPDQPVTVVQAEWHGTQAMTLTYRDDTGRVDHELLYRANEEALRIEQAGRAWSFDADGGLFRLVSEALRIRLAHLFDPYLAVHTSNLDPLPHQIRAVYGEMLPRQPLRFLLADDPGAGKRWQAMAQHLGDPGEETLSGDFIQLLIREGLVKPEPVETSDLEALNAGYNVFLRLDALLGELDTHVTRLLPGAKGRSGATKFSTWRVWNASNVDVGLAFLAAEWTSRPHTNPVAHAWVLNRDSSDEDRLRAVGVEAGNRSKWTASAQLNATYGLNQFGPAIGRPLSEVLVGETFDEQVSSAATFMRDALEFFTGRGYVPRR